MVIKTTNDTVAQNKPSAIVEGTQLPGTGYIKLFSHSPERKGPGEIWWLSTSEANVRALTGGPHIWQLVFSVFHDYT
jgi:hypothetical protein